MVRFGASDRPSIPPSARRRPGRAIPKLGPPSRGPRPAPALFAGRSPPPPPDTARAHPPPGSTRVYLRARSRRSAPRRRRRRPHRRFLGRSHSAAKFPNTDSVRFEVLRGRWSTGFAGPARRRRGSRERPGMRFSARPAALQHPLLASAGLCPRSLRSPELTRAHRTRQWRAKVTSARPDLSCPTSDLLPGLGWWWVKGKVFLVPRPEASTFPRSHSL